MKKIIWGMIVFLTAFMAGLLTTMVFAKEYESAIQPHQPVYFLFGDNEHQTKWQISAKYNLIYPSDVGLYLAFTQNTKWIIYNGRDTMYSMYQPEAIYRFESGRNMFGDYVIPLVDYIQVSPIYHCSTGVEGDNHRSMNQYYGQIQFSKGDVYNFGVNGRIHGYYDVSSQNKDINVFKKNYEADVFFKLKSKTVKLLDKYELHAKCSGNPFGYGYYILEGQFTLFTAKIQPKFYVQYFKGYGETMVGYNQYDEVVRFGILLE